MTLNRGTLRLATNKSVANKSLAKVLALAAIGFLLLAGSCRSSASEMRISKLVKGSALSVMIRPDQSAGAIRSLTFRGVEYVDNFDHGRQIQSALQVDGLGECYNPTEAGSKADGAESRTSSVSQIATTHGNSLRTTTRAAFWLSPFEDYGHQCSPNRMERRAQNRVRLSDYLISKTVQFSDTIVNLLSVDIEFRFPEARRTASIEALTAYLPKEFTSFFSYDPAARKLTTLRTDRAGAMSMYPVIVTTADGRNAMGIISADIARRLPSQGYYAYFYFSGPAGAAKWSCVFNESAIAAGSTLHYRCPIAVGTVEEVIRAFDSYAAAHRIVRGNANRLATTRWGGSSFRFSGSPFTPFRSTAPGRVALYACEVAGTADRFVSTRMDCEGMRPAGQIGYARREAEPGLVPLVRFYREVSGEHLITTLPREGIANGYHSEGILGYVRPWGNTRSVVRPNPMDSSNCADRPFFLLNGSR